MADRTVAQMHADARRWIDDALSNNNQHAAVATWYVTRGEMAALLSERYCPPEPTHFYGMPLKVIYET